MKNLDDIEIETVQDILPSLLMNKFNFLGLKTLGDILDLTSYDFSFIDGAGIKCISELKLLQKKIKINPQEYRDYYKRITKIHKLPINKPDSDEFHLRLLDQTLLDFVSLIKEDLYKTTFINSFGLHGNKVYTINQIASICSVSRVRIRQIQIDLLNQVGELLQGGTSNKFKCRIRKPLVSLLNELTGRIKSLGLFTCEQLNNILLKEFDYRVSSKQDRLIRLFLESIGTNLGSKYDCPFTKAEYIYCNITQKNDFIYAAQQTLKVLRNIVIPINEMNAIVEVKRNNEHINDEYIRIAINSLPEIEILSDGVHNQYQVRFESLGNVSNQIYRILKERGTSMYIDDIVTELNQRLANSDLSIVHTRYNCRFVANKRFIPKQKTGFWDLTEWNLNTDKIEDLVRNTLCQLDRPSTIAEITSIIKKERPQLKDDSIYSLICRDCLKVEGDKYILPIWKERYQNLAVIEKKRLLNLKERRHITLQRQSVIEYLNKIDNQGDFAVKIVASLLPVNPQFNKQALYKLFREVDHFKRFEKDGKIFVQYIQPINNKMIM